MNQKRKRGQRKRGPKVRKNRKRTTGNVSRVRRPSLSGDYGGSLAVHPTTGYTLFSRSPNGPVRRPTDRGNMYSTCQEVVTFASSVGIVDGTATALPFIAAATSNLYFSLGFELQDLDQVASFQGLFDQYRIDKVEVNFVPRDNSINTMNVATPNATIPQLMIAMDFDDLAAPTSMAYIRQYDNVQSVSYGDGAMKAIIEPSYTPSVYTGGAFSGYIVQRSDWLDAGSANVPHYGLKGVITSLTGSSTQTCFWNIHCKYFLSFRNIR